MWLNYLKTVGFDGWRLDFVRGYGGKYVKEYINSTVGRPRREEWGRREMGGKGEGASV
jgi:endo-alpha-1,4-polygalactosaminidase (GH114 family)